MGPLFCNAEALRSAVSRLSAAAGKLLLFLLVVGLVYVPVEAQSGAAGNSVVPSRVINAIDSHRLVQLKGNTHSMARAQFDRGMVSSDISMGRMMLVLQRSDAQEQALAAFTERQQEPSSADYHHWLHADEFGKLYGPSDGDMAAVTSWLQNSGFTIEGVSKGRTTIEFTGTAGQVQQAFHTEIHRYMVNGEMHIANDRDPQIPDALAPVVKGVASLHDFHHKPQSVLGRNVMRDSKTGAVTPYDAQAKSSATNLPATASGKLTVAGANAAAKSQLTFTDPNYGYTKEDVTPYDFATIYNVLPLWNSQIIGTGVKIAISGVNDITAADVASFRSSFGLPAKAFTTMHNGTDPGTSTDGSVENTLDVEMAAAAAPGADVILVVSADTTTTGGDFLSDSYIIDNEVAPIMSASYGECELNLGAASNTAYNMLWQQGAVEGISIFNSSGDQGSAGCTSQNGQAPYADNIGLQVNGLASSPYQTAVGGTDFTWSFVSGGLTQYWNSTNGTQLQTVKGYLPEVPWNSTCANPLMYPLFTGYTSSEQLCNAAINSSAYDGLVSISAGSGGVSHCTTGGTDNATCTGGWAKPTWQAGPGVPADGKRDLPDVSFFASYGFSAPVDGSAILFCYSASAPGKTCDYANPSHTIYQEVGGTSASSPYMAGVMALVVQKTGASQGLANPVLYQLAQAQATANKACDSSTGTTSNGCVFNDISQGTNSQVCITGDPDCVTSKMGDQVGLLSGYNAGIGYDLAVGLGSINVNNLVNSWPAATGTATVTLTPGSLTFASTTVGATSKAQVATLTNTGTTTLNIGGVNTAGTNASAFGETTTCGTTLAAGANCTVSVTFQPTAAGSLTASLSVSDNATGTPQTVALSGTAIAAPVTATLAPGSLTFAATTLGSSAASQMVTLTNTGTTALNISGVSLAGANASSFGETTTCGATLAASANCTVSVTFTPGAAGALTATLSVADNATGSPQTVSLSGTGVVVPTTTTLTTAPATAGVGASVTLTATVKGTGITPSGTVTFYSGTTSLGTGTLNGSGVATLTTSFSTAATFSFTAVYAGNATTGGSTSAAVTETIVPVGVTVTTTPSPLTITRGSTGTMTITVTPTGGYTGAVGLACGTLPAYVTCSFNSATVTVNSATAITSTLTIGTTVTTTAKLEMPTGGRESSAMIAVAGLWLPGAVLAFVGLGRRKRLSSAARRLLLLVVLCVGLGGASMLSGCGGGSPAATTTTPTTTTNTAAAGTYSIPINVTPSGGSVLAVSASITIQ